MVNSEPGALALAVALNPTQIGIWNDGSKPGMEASGECENGKPLAPVASLPFTLTANANTVPIFFCSKPGTEVAAVGDVKMGSTWLLPSPHCLP